MWNNNISIITKEYRFWLRINGWGKIIDLYAGENAEDQVVNLEELHVL